MVAEIQHSKTPLLPKEDDDHAASPVEPVAEALPETRSDKHKAPSIQHDHGAKAAREGTVEPLVCVGPFSTVS